LELRAEISNPNIAQIELLENNSKIRINCISKGQANIIIIDPIKMNIYDVFMINISSSIVLPERIVLNIGGEIDFIKKDPEKRAQILIDSDWIVDDSEVFKFDDNTGKGIALREGITRVHLVSKDLRKEKLATEILVSKIRRINVDFSKLPKYFTDIVNDSFYRKEYAIPLKFYTNDNLEELSNNSEDNVNFIDQNLNVKCISKQPEIFLAEFKDISYEKFDEITKKDNDNFCIITIRKIPFDVVLNFLIL